MVTEEEWNGSMELLRRNIDGWAYRLDLTDKERYFLQGILLKLLDQLDKADWSHLQKYLKNNKENNKELM